MPDTPNATTPASTETTATNTPTIDTTGVTTTPAPTNQPTPVSNPTTISPNTPHARLLNMIQLLAVGVDSFAKAAATHGREGGVGEVQDFEAKQQQAEQQQQKAQQESEEHDLRLKTMNANLLINQMQYQHAMQLFPLQQKEAQLKLQNDTIHEFVDEKTTGESMGYDMNDPAQAAEARQRMGVGSASAQPGAITIPFSAGQKTEDVTAAMTKALPPGASLTDYKIMPVYNDDKHGTGGTITLVPNNSPIMTMGATPRQIAMAQAETEGALNMAKAGGLSESPTIQKLQGQYDNMKSILANGGKPTTGDLFTMHMSVNGPVAKLTADAGEAAKLQQERTKAAEGPATDTVGKAIAVANNPNFDPATRDAARKQIPELQAAENEKVRTDAYARAVAEGKGTEAMYNYGTDPVAIDPVTKQHPKLTLDNAPDSFLVNTSTGQPIPAKMVASLAATQTEKNRADFAASVLHTLDNIDKLRDTNNLPNGPISGITTGILAKAGLGSADAQKALNDIALATSAATGAHVGGRFSVPVMEKMQGLLKLNMNDSQFKGAEDSIRDVMNNYVANAGRYTVGQWKELPEAERQQIMSEGRGARGQVSPAGPNTLQKRGKFDPNALPDAH